ncbi:MAG TPA: prolyl oligopeptidase family serine peptidase [Polyangiaceae bacterium]|nr:prolyl oligopeptidase family serine peptidase [Polyangiaceae bacterium]
MTLIAKCFVTSMTALALLAQCVAPSERNQSKSAEAQPPRYPATRRVDVVENRHGIDVRDPYRWLEDDAADEVKRWMHEQDALTRASIAKIAVRDDLLRRMQSLAHQDRRDVPQHAGQRYFYTHRKKTEERAVLCWKDEADGRERTLVDPSGWAKDHAALGFWRASWDGKNVAYEVKPNNSDSASLHVIDVGSGRASEIDIIGGVQECRPQWTPRGDGFYYVHFPTDPSKRGERHALGEVRFHKLGTPATADAIVREPTPGQEWLQVTLGPEGRWLIATVWFAFTESEVYIKDLDSKSEWQVVTGGRRSRFMAQSYRDTLFLYSTDGAPSGEIFAVDPKRPDRAAWRRVVAENAESPLLDFDVLGGRLALLRLQHVASRLDVHEMDGRFVRTVPAPPLTTIHTPVGSPDDDDAWFESESFTEPPRIHRTSMRTGETSISYASAVGADLSRFETEQLFYHSKDGTRIPMFLVHERGWKRDGSAPLLLHGYGGFNWAQRPAFDPFLIPWLERGGAYAVANVRGGSEYGEAWHQAAMRHKKQNAFDDFIAGAEFLVRENYTRKERLGIHGLSNGGLLVAAVVTQRPDLFRAALCEVPLADMVRFRLPSKNTNAGPGELGSPDDPVDFRALFAYSPYHHVAAATAYPSMLITVAETDERAAPMHARKLAAAMQAATTGGPVLLRVEWNAGHHGTDTVSLDAERFADEYAFLWAQLTAHR